jgi:hypothetical protein
VYGGQVNTVVGIKNMRAAAMGDVTRRWAAVAALALCGMMFAPAAARAEEEVPLPGTIKGTVTNASTTTALAGVTVCATTEEGLFGVCAASETSGNYTIKVEGGGSYEVGFETPLKNFVTQYYSGKSSLREADPVAVAAGQTVSGIDAQMQEGGEVSGTVLSATSKQGITDAEVCLLVGETKFGGCALTDGAGHYNIEGILPGIYNVQFSSPEGGDFFTQYYKGRRSIATAEGLEVQAREPLAEIDAELQEPGAVSGTVLNLETKTPVPGVEVCAVAGGPEPPPKECQQTDGSGDYTISGLEGGSYELTFSSPAFLAKSEAVVVGPGEQTVNAELQEGGKISGFVTGALSKAGIEGALVCARVQEGEHGPKDCTLTAAEGAYTIEGLEGGSYRVEFGGELEFGAPTGFVTQFYNDVPSFAGSEGLEVTEGKTLAEIDAELLLSNEAMVRVSVAGEGSVSSEPAGIECGKSCSQIFQSGTSVTLTATPTAGSTFTGWSGGCSGTDPCVLIATGSTAVTANFAPAVTPPAEEGPPPPEAEQPVLSIVKAGEGSGTVSSDPAGISCGTSCSHAFSPGTKVTLTPTADPTSVFVGWSGGGCGAITRSCVVTLGSSQTVIASFVRVTVLRFGAGIPRPTGSGEAGSAGAGAGGKGVGQAGVAGSFARLVTRSVTVGPSGALVFKLTCPPGAGSCSGTLTLSLPGKGRGKPTVVGRASFRVPAGKVKALTVHLSARAQKLLARARVLKATATIVEHRSAGASHTTHTPVTLHLRARNSKR